MTQPVCNRSYECYEIKDVDEQYPFVDVTMLKLNKSCTDRCNVTLLAGECHSARTLRVSQLRVGVDTGIADTTVQTSHDQRQLHWSHVNNINIINMPSAISLYQTIG